VSRRDLSFDTPHERVVSRPAVGASVSLKRVEPTRAVEPLAKFGAIWYSRARETTNKRAMTAGFEAVLSERFDSDYLHFWSRRRLMLPRLGPINRLVALESLRG
jgi:hypothetical protein